jgi:chemotaxis regulatin CheY-phosphate phosphatase CheZ
MSDISRRRRLTGTTRQLLKIALQQKNYIKGHALALLVAQLEGWVDVPGQAVKKLTKLVRPGKAEAAAIPVDWGQVLDQED